MSASDQGIYSATAALAETVSAVGLAVVSVVYPNLSATWEAGDRAKALKDLDLAVRITAVILLVTGVVLVVLGRWLIALLLGDQYGPGAVVLPYLVVYYLFTIHVSIFGIYPPLIEKTYASTIGFTVAMPCTILLNMTLIPRLGIVGAALATMLSYVLMWVIVLSICRRWGLPVKKRTVVMCLLSFALLLPWYASLPVVGLTAYVCARRTWILSAEEKEKAGSDVSRMLALARRVLHQEK
jgi:O-antigen/teichoic acid export membrane protein